ncbi:uncharacterized protein LOC132051001 [Lycium ferocissimum]|uniref:uncharacterized protein LOC132051001 n=1 Tax=Lycium ferocissimum TaxID=112874 RepID=UPI0028149701|nr:uncharacterized protein LOC132051001 [Lycium ferocissimum]
MQEKRKDVVIKVIAAVTVGKDVSSLFTDVVNCMPTENLELKKLVYLYLISFAKSQPDLAILAVNTFVKMKVSLRNAGNDNFIILKVGDGQCSLDFRGLMATVLMYNKRRLPVSSGNHEYKKLDKGLSTTIHASHSFPLF